MIFRFLLQETNVFLAALSRARVLASPLEMPKMVQTARKVHQTSAFWDSVRYDTNILTISSDTFFLLIRKILSLTFRCFARFLVNSLLLSASWKISVQLGGSLSRNFYHLRNLNGKGTQEVSRQQTKWHSTCFTTEKGKCNYSAFLRQIDCLLLVFRPSFQCVIVMARLHWRFLLRFQARFCGDFKFARVSYWRSFRGDLNRQ